MCWGWVQGPIKLGVGYGVLGSGVEQGEGAGAVPGTCPGSYQVERAAEVLGQSPSAWLRCMICISPGLVELLNRAQSCRANDQRGLLSKEDLVLPDFLQLPVQDNSACEGSDQPSAPQAGSKESSCPQEEPALAQPSLDHKL